MTIRSRTVSASELSKVYLNRTDSETTITFRKYKEIIVITLISIILIMIFVPPLDPKDGKLRLPSSRAQVPREVAVCPPGTSETTSEGKRLCVDDYGLTKIPLLPNSTAYRGGPAHPPGKGQIVESAKTSQPKYENTKRPPCSNVTAAQTPSLPPANAPNTIGEAVPTVVNIIVYPQQITFPQFSAPPEIPARIKQLLEKDIDQTHCVPPLITSAKAIQGPLPGTQTNIIALNEMASQKYRIQKISTDTTKNLQVFLNTTVALSGPHRSHFLGYRTEPSLANKGDLIFYTGNWFAARSSDGGSTWTYSNPFSDMRDFCCDQNVIYDPNHQVFIWYRQGLKDTSGDNHFRLGFSADAVNWSFYDFKPTDFNRLWTNQWFDYPQLAFANKHLFITSNIFDANGNFLRSVISRWSLEDMTHAKSNLQFSYYTGNSQAIFNFTPVQGATDTMYWAAHLSPGTNMRIYKWPEDVSNTTRIVWINRGIVPWNASNDLNCPDPNGKNWCAFSDSRLLSGWVSNGKLGFFWNADKGSGFPHAYIDGAVFQARDMAYIGRSYLWSPSYSWQFGDAAPNARGDLGIIAFYGGTHQYPSIAVGISSTGNTGGPGTPSLALLPTPWELQSVVNGTNGPLSNEWGDFITVRPYSGFGLLWVASGYSLQGGRTQDFIVPSYLVFGSVRDAFNLTH